MSRIVRRKFPTASVKASNRRGSDSSSSLDLSSDTGYSGVEQVSDSEDDDSDDVDAVEANNIQARASLSAANPRPHHNLVELSEDDDSVDDEDDGVNEDNDDDDDEHDSIVAGFYDEYEDVSWAGIPSSPEKCDFYNEATGGEAVNTGRRHVHFDIPWSDSDATETEDDHTEMFPDLFVSKNLLEPSFRRRIEADDDDETSSSNTFWDFVDEGSPSPDEMPEEVAVEFSLAPAAPIEVSTAGYAGDPQELDGYETDGDTTEDEVPDPAARRKIRRPSPPASTDSDSETEHTPKHQRGHPRVGRFNLDKADRKPIAVANPETGKLVIFTPHHRRPLDLSPEQFRPVSWPGLESPSMFTHSADMMMGAAFTTELFGQSVAPAEAFFSGTNVAEGSSPSVDWDDDPLRIDDFGEENLKIEDFLRDSSEEENDQGWAPSSTPARPTTASSEPDVLAHLKPEHVGAFRRNQIEQQLIFGGKATQDSLAFSGPYNNTAIKGLRSDRFDTAAAPLTPIRRHKKQPSDFTRSPLETVSNKRKASAEAAESSAAGHKKQRSISDVNRLHL